jgi:hypothetical protein
MPAARAFQTYGLFPTSLAGYVQQVNFVDAIERTTPA